MDEHSRGERSLADLLRGSIVRERLAKGLPDSAGRHLGAAFAGDEEAARSLVIATPNHLRGVIAATAYWSGIANPAYRGIIQQVWDHDFQSFLDAARNAKIKVRQMMKEAELEIPFRQPLVVYRGVWDTTFAKGARGLSWTKSRDVACWFAYRYSALNPKALVLTCTIDPSDIVYWSDIRQEQEIVFRGKPAIKVDDSPETWIDAADKYRAAIRHGLDRVSGGIRGRDGHCEHSTDF